MLPETRIYGAKVSFLLSILRFDGNVGFCVHSINVVKALKTDFAP